MEAKLLRLCEDLVRDLPTDEKTRFKQALNREPMLFVDPLHEGLTSLAVSCMELGVLFDKLRDKGAHNVIFQKLTVGYIFEVYNSIWSWVGKPVKSRCEAKGTDQTPFNESKRKLDRRFAQYAEILSAVRNGAFHTKDSGDWVDLVTRLLFAKKIPEELRYQLYVFGYEVNVISFEKGLYGCYPGIGGFGAVHPSGKVRPMKDMYYAGTSIKITPEAP